ncbi:MAG: Mur ligase family protein [bacterium]|nr:Mur ligase family protein [bacterium]
MIDFAKIRSVHFIGVGGIGTSAIARMFLSESKKVSGSDRAPSEITDELMKLGAEIVFGEQTVGEIPERTDLIIYTAAIEVAEPAFLEEIKKLSIPSCSYSEALGEISRDKTTIAIAGTHGKTTTTGMVATVLIDVGLQPTVIVGSVLTREHSNFVAGTGDLFVVEADEYRRSFLSLRPKILVINNLDLDHLDYFKDMADIQSAYASLVAKVPKDGVIITDPSHPHIAPVLAGAHAPILDYRSESVDGLKLPLPGAHNILNAQVALAVGRFLGVPRERMVSALTGFQGTWRRFEFLGETSSGALVYDDYAHNPQKVKALLSGLREKFPTQKIRAVFQPHLYSRTKTLFDGFVNAFGGADEVIFIPIFPAREALDPSISSDMLALAVEKARGKDSGVTSLHSFEEAEHYLKENVKKGDVVVTVGAGDVYKIAKNILN